MMTVERDAQPRVLALRSAHGALIASELHRALAPLRQPPPRLACMRNALNSERWSTNSASRQQERRAEQPGRWTRPKRARPGWRQCGGGFASNN